MELVVIPLILLYCYKKYKEYKEEHKVRDYLLKWQRELEKL